jgi:hypothetical protein
LRRVWGVAVPAAVPVGPTGGAIPQAVKDSATNTPAVPTPASRRNSRLVIEFIWIYLSRNGK